MKWRNTLLPFLAVIAAITASHVVVYTAGRCSICSEFDKLLPALEDILGGIEREFRRPCDGSKKCCVYQLLKCIKKLLLYVGDQCYDCDLYEILTTLKLVLQIHWSDGGGYDTLPWLREDTCVQCLVSDIKDILHGLIIQNVRIDVDDLDCSSQRCAVAKLLPLLKIFAKDLLLVMQDPPEEVDCDDDNWSCLLRRLKYMASQKHNKGECTVCINYSCEQCRRDNACKYCNNHYNCGDDCDRF